MSQRRKELVDEAVEALPIVLLSIVYHYAKDFDIGTIIVEWQYSSYGTHATFYEIVEVDDAAYTVRERNHNAELVRDNSWIGDGDSLDEYHLSLSEGFKHEPKGTAKCPHDECHCIRFLKKELDFIGTISWRISSSAIRTKISIHEPDKVYDIAYC